MTALPSNGLIERAITRLLVRSAQIVEAVTVSTRFRRIEMQGDALRHVRWRLGDKVQIKLDGSLRTRTYTPLSWDEDSGAMRIVAYCHGDGPGSAWAARAIAGDAVFLFGPRRSLELSAETPPAVLFGDETSFGLAAALVRRWPVGLRCIFEVDNEADAAVALAVLGIGNATVICRQPEDAHFGELSRLMLRTDTGAGLFVLSGKASSIQTISRALKASGVRSTRLRTKAYWAVGKSGLD